MLCMNLWKVIKKIKKLDATFMVFGVHIIQNISKKAKIGKTFIGTEEYRQKVKELEALEEANKLKSKADGTVTTQGKSPFAYTLDEVIEMNVDKLKARYPGGEFSVRHSEVRKEGDV